MENGKLKLQLFTIFAVSFFLTSSAVWASDCSTIPDSEPITALSANGCVADAVALRSITLRYPTFIVNGHKISEGAYDRMRSGKGRFVSEIWPNLALTSFHITKRKHYVLKDGNYNAPVLHNDEFMIYAANGFPENGQYSITIGDFKKSLRRLFSITLISR